MNEKNTFRRNIIGTIAVCCISFLLLFALINENEKIETEVDKQQNIENVEKTPSVMPMVETIGMVMFFGGAFIITSRLMQKQGRKARDKETFVPAIASEADFITFSDVAGNEEAKESVSDIVDFIKNPEKYDKYGARIPRGVVFYGPPGTGKTMLAKALAGEAGAPFYAVSGSDFVQMYVGVGASRIRSLFSEAKKRERAVIFIDEIDALGKKRSGSGSSGNDERDQTLNALLTEMSGFSSSSGIVVIAATNRLDTLDEALLRPGRFDRHVEVNLPDLNSRKAILSLHMKNKPVEKDIDISGLAAQTVYFSGAMLENLLNEAAISAAKEDAKTINAAHIDKAYYTVIAGAEKIDRTGRSAQDAKITAVHEAGHALVTKLTSPENSVLKVTIIPSTRGAGGFSVNVPRDKMFYTKQEMCAQMMIALAGRAAEEVTFGEENVTTGASNDLERASVMSRDYAGKYGMSETVGLLNMEVFRMDADILSSSKALLNELYEKTRGLIRDKEHILHKIANLLMEKETINEDELNHIISG